ncbi:hypothetical protein Acr_01g0009930 [Actinidia rufa]|uniref:Retrovirus-related Pol polyprotein from transposon TNT 1-94-like beta-barrel domain-containing protein n=1 Tax=Actinidia rufa TaxID=165716 RepID=A0A7J0E3W1_9ERIC|nr:hypothetical protein Acr_01g0009930 [Actinidia rufa]
MRSHAPPDHRRVRLVSATRRRGPTHCHTPGRCSTRWHAPGRDQHSLSHARGEETIRHAPARTMRPSSQCHVSIDHPVSVQSAATLALLEISRHSRFIHGLVFGDFAFIWEKMKDILFCNDLHEPLENKRDKPIATNDEKWRKMNRKTIERIGHCIGHEVFHYVVQETSAYELWIKLEEIYQVKTSWNKALLMRRLFDDEMQALLLLSSLLENWETLVVSLSNSAPNGKLTTSMVMDALFNEEARRREMGTIDQSESQSLVSEGSSNRGQGQGRCHHRDESDVLLAASVDGKSDWELNSGTAYHLCRDREVFSTYAACEGCIWMANNTASRVVGNGSVRFCIADGRSVTLTEVRHVPNLRKNLISIEMLDSKGCNFKANEGTLRVFKENKEMLWRKKTRDLYRLEGSVQTERAIVRHGSSSISENNGQGKQLLYKGMQSKRMVVRTREKRCSHDNSQSDVLCGVPRWGMQGILSYGGARPKAVRMNNLKISAYPLVGWRGRLLSPVHLDKSKSTWRSLSPVTKPKPKPSWGSHGVSM